MHLTHPEPGQIVLYLGAGEPLHAEITDVGPPYAYLGGARVITAALLETSRDRCWSAGSQVQGHDLIGDTFRQTAKVPKRIRPLPETTVYGGFRGGQLWDWYGYGGSWIPADAQQALSGRGPVGAPLFASRDHAEQFLRESVDAEPGDTVDQVTAKTWRGDQYRYARILTPPPPTPRSF